MPWYSKRSATKSSRFAVRLVRSKKQYTGIHKDGVYTISLSSEGQKIFTRAQDIHKRLAGLIHVDVLGISESFCGEKPQRGRAKGNGPETAPQAVRLFTTSYAVLVAHVRSAPRTSSASGALMPRRACDAGSVPARGRAGPLFTRRPSVRRPGSLMRRRRTFQSG